MDDPDLDRTRHLQALRALARINRVSFAGLRVYREILTIGRSRPGPVRVLDVACGGGDVLVDVANRLRGSGLAVELRGCDVSEVALEAARLAVPRGADVDFLEADVIDGDIPGGHDLVCSSLFLHHLTDEAASQLLRRMAAVTAHTVLVQDLRRTRLGYLFAWVGLHTLTRSDVARSDGLVSVRAAFTLPEAEQLCSEAGLSGASVSRAWPQRYTIRWRRERG